MASSLKNETEASSFHAGGITSIVLLSVASLLKNETVTSHVRSNISLDLVDVKSSLSLVLVFKPSFHPLVSFFSI